MPTASRTAAILPDALGRRGLLQRGLGVLVEELTGRHQMTGHDVGGRCGPVW